MFRGVFERRRTAVGVGVLIAPQGGDEANILAISREHLQG